VIVHSEPIFGRTADESEDDAPPRRRASRRDRNGGANRPADDLEQIDPERRRAAASAMAAIHKATVVDGEEVDEDDADADAAHRNGVEPAIDLIEPVELIETGDAVDLIEAADREQVPEPVLELALDFEPVNSDEPVQTPDYSATAAAEPVEPEAPVTRAPAAPRRRRAASRPAGPPVGSAPSLEPVGSAD
jgi:ribonuclease E